MTADIPENYKTALTSINESSRQYGVEWAVTGSIGRALQGMRFIEGEPEDIDIVVNRRGLEFLYDDLEGYANGEITYNAEMEIGDNQLSFHKFEAEIEGVDVEFLGDFEVNSESVYGDYEPNDVEVKREEIPAVPLDKELEGNRKTGRHEIADRVEDFLTEN